MSRLLALHWLAHLLRVEVIAAPWQPARQTIFVDEEAYGLGWNPLPTPATVLQKRQDVGHNTCGYINGQLDNPLTCLNSTFTCITDRALSAIGCCNTAPVGPSSFRYAQCGFHTGCSDYPATVIGSSNPLIRTCSADLPICQLVDYIAANGIYSDYICSNIPLTKYLEPTPVGTIDPSLFTTFPSSSLASTSSTGPSAVPTPTIPPSSGLSPGLSAGSIAGIVLGSIFGLSALISLLWTYLFCIKRNHRRTNEPPPQYSADTFNHPTKPQSWLQPASGESGTKKLNQASEIPSGPPAWSNPLTEQGQKTDAEVDPFDTFLRGNSTATKHLDFPTDVLVNLLRIYGKRGVPIRELQRLVFVRYILTRPGMPGEFSYLESARPQDERPFVKKPPLASGLVDLNPGVWEALEERLTKDEIIEVVRGSCDHLLSEQQGWTIDDRIWLAESSDYRHELQHFPLLHLLDIFEAMPDKCAHPLAERYRELYYYHAHAMLVFVVSKVRHLSFQIPEECESGMLSLLLKVLTHRHQDGDTALLYTASTISLNQPHTYSRVQFQLAELKKLSHIQASRSLDELERTRLKVILASMQDLHEVHLMTSRARDTVGYAFVEIMNIAEGLQIPDLLSESVKGAETWCQLTRRLDMSRAFSTIICILVKLKHWDQLELLPQTSHLVCGYETSRAGALTMAERFLKSGLRSDIYEDRSMTEKLTYQFINWRYEHELMTVLMRLGRWSEAGRILNDSYLATSTHLRASKLWITSGEFGDYKLSADCLKADLQIANGSLKYAEVTLHESMKCIERMRDHFIRATRVATKSRLLDVQMEIPAKYPVEHTALSLWEEIKHPETFPLDPGVIQWTIQQLFACVNKLIGAQRYNAAEEILIQLRERNNIHVRTLFEGAEAYLEDKAIAISSGRNNQREYALLRLEAREKSGANQDDDIVRPNSPGATQTVDVGKQGSESESIDPSIERPYEYREEVGAHRISLGEDRPQREKLESAKKAQMVESVADRATRRENLLASREARRAEYEAAQAKREAKRRDYDARRAEYEAVQAKREARKALRMEDMARRVTELEAKKAKRREGYEASKANQEKKTEKVPITPRRDLIELSEKQQMKTAKGRKWALSNRRTVVPRGQQPSAVQNTLNMLRLVRLESPPTNDPIAATVQQSKNALTPVRSTALPVMTPVELTNLPSASLEGADAPPWPSSAVHEMSGAFPLHSIGAQFPEPRHELSGRGERSPPRVFVNDELIRSDSDDELGVRHGVGQVSEIS